MLLLNFKNGDGTGFGALMETGAAADTIFRFACNDGKITLNIDFFTDRDQFFGAGGDAASAAFALILADLDTMFLTSEHQYMYLSSSTVKELGGYDVDLSDFLPEQIIPVFKKRMSDIRLGGER